MNDKPSHRVLTKDPERRRGVCSACGETRISKRGKYWRCSNADAARSKNWRKARPAGEQAAMAKVRQAKARLNPHSLIEYDVQSATGTCLACGPDIPIGRVSKTGWGCATRYTCRCEDVEPTWAYRPPGYPGRELCEPCCSAVARGLVAMGLLEPVLELTWPENRVSWDSAMYELGDFDSMEAA